MKMPYLTEQQKIQQELFIGGLVHFLDVAGNIQEIFAQEQKLQLIHLAFLRRANVRGSVSFDRIRAELRAERYTISRAAALLEKSKLGKIVNMKSDGRYRGFFINKKGRDVIESIDYKIAQMVALQIHVVDLDSRRYLHFTNQLCNLVSFLPYTGVTHSCFKNDIHFAESASAEEIQGLKKKADLAVRPSKAKMSMDKSIIQAWNLMMVQHLDPEGWDDFVRSKPKERASSNALFRALKDSVRG
jgi:DNA-binding MarR family transcriptional regulator